MKRPWRHILLCGLLAGIAMPVAITPSTARALQPIDRDVRAACKIYAPGLIVSAVQHGDESGEGGADSQVLDNAKDAKWFATYRAFSRSGAPRRLLAYANGHYKMRHQKSSYSPAVCRRLRPISGAAATAVRISTAGAPLPSNPMVVHCPSGKCLPAAIQIIEERCDFSAFAVPLPDICR